MGEQLRALRSPDCCTIAATSAACEGKGESSSSRRRRRDTGKSLYWNGLQYSPVYLRMDVPFITTDKDGKLVDKQRTG